jgi:uncharacterized protein YjbJ (UPF0337 family)
MAEEPDQLRRDIESTRVALTRDVDLLAEKTSPAKAAQRRWTSVKERVMGTSEHARQAAGGAASSAAGTVQDKAGTVQDKASQIGGAASEKVQDAAAAVRRTPGAVVAQAQGSPLAAGVIAFGVGLVAAALFPATTAERRAGQELREHSGDLTGRVREAATGLKDELSESVQQAVGEVKDTAREAAHTTTEQARSSAQGAAKQTTEAARSAS